MTQPDKDGYLILQLHKSAWAANDYCWANKPDVWQFIWQSSGKTNKKQERLSYISPASTFAHTKHRTWYISLTSRVSYKIHCQGVILIKYQYDEGVVFAGKVIDPSILRIQDVFFIIMLIFINRYNEHDEGVAFAETGDPSVHPSNHPSDATTAKETTLLPNQCKPMHCSSICKFRFFK